MRGNGIWALICLTVVNGISLDITSSQSIKSASQTVARDLLSFYNAETQTFPGPYSWWQVGQMVGALIDYQYYTGDSAYQSTIQSALQKQSENQYRPFAQIGIEANDDQAFWSFALMSALERGFPPTSGLDYAQAAIAIAQQQMDQWDTATCGGGLRWQYRPENKGWNYKNNVSNGSLFALLGRLARWTGDKQYVAFAQKIWDWTVQVKLQDRYIFFDGTAVLLDCRQVDHTQVFQGIQIHANLKWTYNPSFYLAGSAYLYDFTQSKTYVDQVNSILDAMEIFYGNVTISETACEPHDCNDDQTSFKGIVARNLGYTYSLIPDTKNTVRKYLEPSAQAAARTCDGGSSGTLCGMDWTLGTWDGKSVSGVEMSALETLQALLASDQTKPKSS